MPYKNKQPYTCPRCGYFSDRKSNMQQHLYGKKKACPASVKDVELTDEIKQHILDNRVYKIPKPAKTTIINNIQNFNTMNNFITNMDVLEKVQHLTSHRNLELINFEDHVRETLYDKVEELKLGDDYIEHRPSDFLDFIDKVSNRQSIEAFNIFYDATVNKLKIFDDGEWCDKLISTGIQDIMRVIQDSYLEHYEFYLVRKLHKEGDNCRSGQRWKEMLIEYYKFLGALDVNPRIKDQSDSEILYDTDDDRYGSGDDECRNIQDRYMPLYEKQKILAKSESKVLKREIFNILKYNSKQSISDLNKAVLRLFKMDDEFKRKFLDGKDNLDAISS